MSKPPPSFELLIAGFIALVLGIPVVGPAAIAQEPDVTMHQQNSGGDTLELPSRVTPQRKKPEKPFDPRNCVIVGGLAGAIATRRDDGISLAFAQAENLGRKVSFNRASSAMIERIYSEEAAQSPDQLRELYFSLCMKHKVGENYLVNPDPCGHGDCGPGGPPE